MPDRVYFRNASWMEDNKLKEDLERYTRQGLQRREILNFVQRDYHEYAWSITHLRQTFKTFWHLPNGSKRDGK